MTKKGRVFGGIRCRGRQHLGNYLGIIQSFVALQDEYDCVCLAVDVHTITTPWQPDELRENVWDTVLDLLAAGIEPERTITSFLDQMVHRGVWNERSIQCRG